jgi:hypothetical protein
MNEVIVREQHSIVEAGNVGVERMLQQVNDVQHAMRSVMKKDVHYGLIPGTGAKPVLLKPGAEKLLMMFRLIPTFDTEVISMQDGHKEYRVVATIKNLEGAIMGQGVGSCSTLESKYRWRQDKDKTITAVPVPKSYWDKRDASILARALEGAGVGVSGKPVTEKTDEGYFIAVLSGTGKRVENPDIADCYNTCLKMAVKRALVAGTIFTLSVSDIFDQDIDETLEGMQVAPRQAQPVQPQRPAPKPEPVQQQEQNADYFGHFDDDEQPPIDAYETDASEGPGNIAFEYEPGPGEPVTQEYQVPYKIDGIDMESFKEARKKAGLRWNPDKKVWHHQLKPGEPMPTLRVKGIDGRPVALDMLQYAVK